MAGLRMFYDEYERQTNTFVVNAQVYAIYKQWLNDHPDQVFPVRVIQATRYELPRVQPLPEPWTPPLVPPCKD